MSSLCHFVPWEKALRSFDDCCPEQFRPRDFQKGGNRFLRTIVQPSIHNGIHYLFFFSYVLKPVIPAGIRFAFRHYHAMPLKWTSAATWPINRAYVGKPANWPGWPNGKQFAFVLSHDVEGEKGLKRCRTLAELEM